MRRMIFFSVIKLLHLIARVESLFGQHFTPIRYGELPFIASLQTFPEERNFCGGTLITNKHVITSTYCIRNLSLESFRIVFEVANVQGPAVAYTAASWTTYIDWAQTRGLPYVGPDLVGPAIITLTDRVDNVNPTPLNQLTKTQLVGKKARLIGWKNDVLSKISIQVLSEEDCNRRIGMLRNDTSSLGDRALCSAANPYALLDIGDMGCPFLNARDNSLLGIACSYSPGDEFVRGNFTTQFIRQNQVNVHVSVHYYRSFIHSFIPAAPAA